MGSNQTSHVSSISIRFIIHVGITKEWNEIEYILEEKDKVGKQINIQFWNFIQILIQTKSIFKSSNKNVTHMTLKFSFDDLSILTLLEV